MTVADTVVTVPTVTNGRMRQRPPSNVSCFFTVLVALATCVVVCGRCLVFAVLADSFLEALIVACERRLFGSKLLFLFFQNW